MGEGGWRDRGGRMEGWGGRMEGWGREDGGMHAPLFGSLIATPTLIELPTVLQYQIS